ncbi:MAG: hypothetical protein KatS3mg102_0082 [Planctomycetota bacterium]|nr:MAG: hypothetical protein KatS3mg102_0082 [Planctomycetota bacterium]
MGRSVISGLVAAALLAAAPAACAGGPEARAGAGSAAAGPGAPAERRGGGAGAPAAGDSALGPLAAEGGAASGADQPPRGTAARPAPRRAEVVDAYGEAMQVEEPYLHLAGRGLFATGRGERLQALQLWRGAHQLLIPVTEIARVEPVGPSPSESDLLVVRVVLQDGERVEGKVDIDLELRGRVRFGEYRVRLERCRRVVFEP